jgi:hypothetical protein
MTILKDNYKNHPVHQTVETTLQFINNYKQKENLTDSNKDSLDAYENLLKYVQYVLNNSITQVVPTQLLTNLQANISNLQNSNVANIENTYNLYSGITSDISKIPVYNDKSIVKIGIGKIIEDFNNEKKNIKQSAINEIEDFKQKQDDEFNKWQEEKEDCEEQLDKLKEENKSLKEKIADLTQNISDEHDRLTSVISKFKEEYEEKKTSFQTDFDDAQKENEDAFKELQASMLKTFNDFHDTSKEKTDCLLEYMKVKENEVEKLWGIIGKAAVSGSSQSYANKAKNFAHLMTFLALGIMGVAIWSLVDVVQDFIHIKIETQKVQIDNAFLIIRLILNIVMFLPAWYCANIANKQRNREFQLRDFEIKTAGLEPFMENMKMVRCNDCTDTPNKKDETKLDLVKEIFTNDLDKKKVDDGNIIIPKDMVELLKSCLESLEKIKGR